MRRVESRCSARAFMAAVMSFCICSIMLMQGIILRYISCTLVCVTKSVCGASDRQEENRHGKTCYLGTTGSPAGQGAGGGNISEVRATAGRTRTWDDQLVCHQDGTLK